MLMTVMDAGLIQANGDNYKYIVELAQQAEANETILESIAFRFVHDRIQQAAYGMLNEAEKQALHFTIGKCLWELDPNMAVSKDLFLVANQMLLGKDLAQGSHIQAQLPGLFFLAGKRSKDAAAFGQAVQFFRASQQQMADDPFAQDYDLAFELQLNLAQSLSVLNQFAEAETLYQLLLTKARHRHEKAKVYAAYYFLVYSNNKFPESISICTEALALFGIQVPTKVQPWHFITDLLRLRSFAKAAKTETIFHWPESNDQDYFWTLQFYYFLSGPCFMLGDENKMAFGEVWDYRDDPEGLMYSEGDIDSEFRRKVNNVKRLADEKAQNASAEKLAGIFGTKTGKGDAVVRKMATTFKALAPELSALFSILPI